MFSMAYMFFMKYSKVPILKLPIGTDRNGLSSKLLRVPNTEQIAVRNQIEVVFNGKLFLISTPLNSCVLIEQYNREKTRE